MAAYAHYAFMYGLSSPGMPPLAEQQAACRAHYETVRERYGWGGEWVDTLEDVREDWRNRPRGSFLFQRVQAGDLIIVAEAGCIFKTTKKALAELRILREKGVEIALLDEPPPSAGRLEWLGWMNDMRSSWSYAIGMFAIHQREKRGPRRSPQAPFGWKVVWNNGRLDHVIDHHNRRWALEFLRLKEEEGMTRDAIYWHMRKRGAKRSNGKEWGACGISRAMAAAKKGFPNRWVEEPQEVQA